jgi:hypothetical protein
MKTSSHNTAQPSYYDEEAKHYDTFNEEASQTINQSI